MDRPFFHAGEGNKMIDTPGSIEQSAKVREVNIQRRDCGKIFIIVIGANGLRFYDDTSFVQRNSGTRRLVQKKSAYVVGKDGFRRRVDKKISMFTLVGQFKSVNRQPEVSIKTALAPIQHTVRRTVRAVRQAVRKTFAARKAAKSSDSGGGSSDPDGREKYNEPNPQNSRSHISTSQAGGAK
jgi:hypothetical protein